MKESAVGAGRETESAAASVEYGVRVVTRAEELSALRADWQRLQQHPNSGFAFYSAALAQHAGRWSPYVVVVESGGSVGCILLGRIEQGQAAAARERSGCLVLPHGGLLGPCGPRLQCLLRDALIAALKRGEIDSVFFHRWPEDSEFLNCVRRSSAWLWRSFSAPSAIHYTMRVSVEGDGALEKRSSKHRAWVRNRRKALATRFADDVRYEHVSEPRSIPEAVAAIERVACKTYQRRMGKGYLGTPLQIARIEEEAAVGKLRAVIIHAGGTPRAFWLGFAYRPVFHSIYTGYDPELSKFELGTLAMVDLVEWVAQEGIEWFDFGLGDAPYKARLADRSWRDVDLWVYRPGVQGFVRNVKSSASVAAAATLRSVTGKLQLLPWLRRRRRTGGSTGPIEPSAHQWVAPENMTR